MTPASVADAWPARVARARQEHLRVPPSWSVSEVADRERKLSRATAPFTGTAGFHISALASPWTRLGELAREFLEAKRHRETLQAFTNLKLAKWWDSAAGETLAWETLRARAEPYELRTLPDPRIGLVTAGCDVQGDRVCVLAIGWGPGEECWVLDWQECFGDPATPEPWLALDDVLAAQPLAPACVAVDSGFATQSVYDYVRRRAPRTIAVKGYAGAGRPILHCPSKQDVAWSGKLITGGVKLWPIGVDSAKAVLHHRLQLEPGPRAIHFATALLADFYQQLVAERLVTKYTRGVAPMEWLKTPGRRNEALDCFCYAYAAALRAGLARMTPAHWRHLAADAGAGEVVTRALVDQHGRPLPSPEHPPLRIMLVLDEPAPPRRRRRFSAGRPVRYRMTRGTPPRW